MSSYIYSDVQCENPKPWPRPGMVKMYEDPDEDEHQHKFNEQPAPKYNRQPIEVQPPQYLSPPVDEEKDHSYKYIVLLLAGLVAALFFMQYRSEREAGFHKEFLEDMERHQIIAADRANALHEARSVREMRTLELTNRLTRMNQVQAGIVNGHVQIFTANVSDADKQKAVEGANHMATLNSAKESMYLKGMHKRSEHEVEIAKNAQKSISDLASQTASNIAANGKEATAQLLNVVERNNERASDLGQLVVKANQQMAKGLTDMANHINDSTGK